MMIVFRQCSKKGEKREAMRKTGREMYKERNMDRRISREGTSK
jgi:hypothetical protein